jgi:phenylacetic acid degradation operon negative regulatory protein
LQPVRVNNARSNYEHATNDVGQTFGVNARSALFDLYGDHLLSRGGAAPVAALVRCLSTLEITSPAARTAISRMVRQGWLEAVRTPSGPGYAVTDRAVARLNEAGARIYRTDEQRWDGRWHLLAVERIPERSRRERVRNGLRYLGYGAIDDTTWIAARRSRELDAFLRTESVVAESFLAAHDGDTTKLVSRVWDLAALAAAYETWLGEARRVVAGVDPRGPEQAFAARSQLVHGWRKFLFVDPRLPEHLLPPDWAGHRGARYFDQQAGRLLPAASRFIDSCLQADGRRAP